MADLPGRKPKKALPVRETAMLIVHNSLDEVLLRRRPGDGLWGGLWSFPECDPGGVSGAVDELADALALSGAPDVTRLGAFRNTFTHFHLDITPVHVRVGDARGQVREDGECWYSLADPPRLGLTRPVVKLLKHLELS